MMTILIQCLPTLLQLVGIGLKKAGAQEDTLKAFEHLVEQTKNDGAVATVGAKNVFANQKSELDAMFTDRPNPPA